jgi:NitT/TauT family transport system permease protein
MTAVGEPGTRAEDAAVRSVPERSRTRRRGPGRRAAVWAARVVLLVGFLVGWQALGSASETSLLFFSTPLDVAERIGVWMADPEWWVDFGVTMQETALGYVLGVAVALVLVCLTAPSRLATRFLAPFIAALNALPKVALAPVFILWFGAQLESKILFVASLISFMIFYGVSAALAVIDQTLIANMRVLGASRFDLVKNVYGPASLGQVISSLRLSSAWALLAAVIAEYLSANKGLGYLIAHGQQTFRTDQVLAGIVIVAVVAVVLDRVLVVVERRLSRWRPDPAR